MVPCTLKVTRISIFIGMPWTDVTRAGMSVQVVAQDDQHLPEARVQAEVLANAVLAGIGAKVYLSVGGKIDNVFSKPIAITGIVQRLTREQPDSKQLDAVLQVDGVTIVLLSRHRAFRPGSFPRGGDQSAGV